MKIKKNKISLNIFEYDKREIVYFIINVLIGIGVAVFFNFMEMRQYGGNILDEYLDRLIQFEASTLQNFDDKKLLSKIFFNTKELNITSLKNLSFIEIDRITLKNWEGINQPIIPRAKVADLLIKVSQKKPKLIIVDILFDVKSCNDDKLFILNLEKAIKKYNAVFVFVSVIDPISEKILYPFFYQDLKSHYPNNIFISSPYLSISEYDNTARFFRFFEIVKKNQKKDILWNTSLIALVLLNNQMELLEKTKKEILESKNNRAIININGKKIAIDNQDLISSRLRFPYSVVIDEETNFLTLRNLPMYPNHLIEDKIKDKIVLIGTTDPIKQDFFKTPVGYMPGMYLIANALFTLSNLQIHHELTIIKLLIQIFVILLAAYFFLWMDSAIATVSSLTLIAFLVPLSILLFLRFNIFINTIFPLLCIITHKNLIKIEEFLINRLDKQKRTKEG